MQTDLFQEDPDIAFQRKNILMQCVMEGLPATPQEWNPRKMSKDAYNRSGWGKTLLWLNRIADEFGVTRWDDLKTPEQSKRLDTAVTLARHGCTHF